MTVFGGMVITPDVLRLQMAITGPAGVIPEIILAATGDQKTYMQNSNCGVNGRYVYYISNTPANAPGSTLSDLIGPGNLDACCKCH